METEFVTQRDPVAADLISHERSGDLWWKGCN